MKFLILAFFAALTLGLSGCSDSPEVEREIHEISDRFFSSQMMTIMHEPDDFLGHIIRYEGIFMSMYWESTSEMIYYVVRWDDCCGRGDVLGLEVYLNDIEPLEDNTWVEITGVLEIVHIAGYGELVRLNAVSLIERERLNVEIIQGR